MSELREGKLRLRNIKDGKQVVLDVPTRKKATVFEAQKPLLSADLRPLSHEELDGLAGC